MTPQIDIANNMVEAVITPSEGYPVTVTINQPVATISSAGIQGPVGAVAAPDDILDAVAAFDAAIA